MLNFAHVDLKENEYVQQRTCDRYLSFSHEYEFSWTMVYCNRIDL